MKQKILTNLCLLLVMSSVLLQMETKHTYLTEILNWLVSYKNLLVVMLVLPLLYVALLLVLMNRKLNLRLNLENGNKYKKSSLEFIFTMIVICFSFNFQTTVFFIFSLECAYELFVVFSKSFDNGRFSKIFLIFLKHS